MDHFSALSCMLALGARAKQCTGKIKIKEVVWNIVVLL